MLGPSCRSRMRWAAATSSFNEGAVNEHDVLHHRLLFLGIPLLRLGRGLLRRRWFLLVLGKRSSSREREQQCTHRQSSLHLRLPVSWRGAAIRITAVHCTARSPRTHSR